jgi:hypothetical protein
MVYYAKKNIFQKNIFLLLGASRGPKDFWDIVKIKNIFLFYFLVEKVKKKRGENKKEKVDRRHIFLKNEKWS